MTQVSLPARSPTRLSVHDLEDEEFFSAPQTRHASIDPVKTSAHNADSARPHYEALVPVREANHPLAEPPDTAAIGGWRPKFTVPWAHEHDPPHDHLSSKVLRRLLKGQSDSRKNPRPPSQDLNRIPLISELRTTGTSLERQSPVPFSCSTARKDSSAAVALGEALRKDQLARTMSNVVNFSECGDEENAEAIVDRIRDYLVGFRYPMLESISNTHRTRDTIQLHSAGTTHADENELYLLSMTDVAMILQIVITGMSSLGHDHSDAKPKNKSLDDLTHGRAAPPAVTYTSVRPSLGSPVTNGRSTDLLCGPDRATIVSRQSITEVDWRLPEPFAGDVSANNNVGSQPSPRDDAVPHGASGPISPSSIGAGLLSRLQVLEDRYNRCAKVTSPDTASLDAVLSVGEDDSRMVTNLSPSSESDAHKDLCPTPVQSPSSPHLHSIGVDAHIHTGKGKGALTISKKLQSCKSRRTASPLALLFGGRHAQAVSEDRPGSTVASPAVAEADQTVGSAPATWTDSSVLTDSKILNVLRRYSFLPMTDQTPENLRQAAVTLKNTDQFPMRDHGRSRPSSQELLQEILDNACQRVKAQKRECSERNE